METFIKNLKEYLKKDYTTINQKVIGVNIFVNDGMVKSDVLKDTLYVAFLEIEKKVFDERIKTDNDYYTLENIRIDITNEYITEFRNSQINLILK